MYSQKLGRIEFNFEEKWMAGGVITPTPYVINEKVIRIFTGFRDEKGISRIGYIDVDAENPLKIIDYSKEPVLDIGSDGSFDDNGMILGDVKEVNGILYAFYIGFQKVEKAKFLAFSGLAYSEDVGLSFKRVSTAPILDRADNANAIKAIHSVNVVEGALYAYYAVGNDWQYINSQPYPRYEIYRAKFDFTTLSFENEEKCISLIEKEYRIGKPTVYRTSDGYLMFYTRGRSDDLSYYEPGIAVSRDGLDWTRCDDLYPIKKGPDIWDSINTAYPKFIETAYSKQYIFYSGNGMGEGGIGVAEVTESNILFEQVLELSTT